MGRLDAGTNSDATTNSKSQNAAGGRKNFLSLVHLTAAAMSLFSSRKCPTALSRTYWHISLGFAGRRRTCLLNYVCLFATASTDIN